jgi:hypothetical protein
MLKTPKMKYFAIYAVILLIACLTADLQRTIFLRPQSVHVWRQCDGASYALNYYQNGNAFFQPATHTQTGKDGRTVSEFPIFYYITGQLYHIFGFHEFILRLLHFSVFIFGGWALFNFSMFFLKNTIWSLVVTFLFMTSPYVFYYAPNFLPNVPALSLALIGWYCFFRYYDSYNIKWWYACVAFNTLTALVKISEGISFIAIGVLVLAACLRSNGFVTIKNIHLKHRMIGIAIVLVAMFGWSQFAVYYNKINGTGQNLLGIFPIWEMTKEEIYQTIDRMSAEWPGSWRTSFHHLSILYMFAIFQVAFFILIARLNALLRAITILLLLGTLAYSLLWFKAFYHHDYYMLTLAIYIPFLIISVTEYLFRVVRDPLVKNTINVSGIMLIIISIWHNSKIQHERYHDAVYQISMNAAVYELEPYLRKIGIKQTDKVVSVPDGSPNISLYLMNQPGWTEIFNDNNYNIYTFVNLGAKYLIVSDSSYLNKPPYNEFTKNKIGAYKGVQIFDIRKNK